MTYQELLQTDEWKKKRMLILKRDNFKCTHCSNKRVIEDLKSGVFIDFEFPGQTNVINIHSFPKGKYVVLGVESKYEKCFRKDSLVYYYKTERGRKAVLGVRKLNKMEYDTYYQSEQDFNNESDEYIKSSKIHEFGELYQKELKSRIKRMNEMPKVDLSKTHWFYLKGLHVHHSYYQVDLNPWEYPDDALTTLCMDCHEELHRNGTIKVYSSAGKFEGLYHYCKRCHGAGWFPPYKHVQEGICFRCNGARFEELIEDAE